jgi:hypothetical protein
MCKLRPMAMKHSLVSSLVDGIPVGNGDSRGKNGEVRLP